MDVLNILHIFVLDIVVALEIIVNRYTVSLLVYVPVFNTDLVTYDSRMRRNYQVLHSTIINISRQSTTDPLIKKKNMARFYVRLLTTSHLVTTCN